MLRMNPSLRSNHHGSDLSANDSSSNTNQNHHSSGTTTTSSSKSIHHQKSEELLAGSHTTSTTTTLATLAAIDRGRSTGNNSSHNELSYTATASISSAASSSRSSTHTTALSEHHNTTGRNPGSTTSNGSNHTMEQPPPTFVAVPTSSAAEGSVSLGTERVPSSLDMAEDILDAGGAAAFTSMTSKAPSDLDDEILIDAAAATAEVEIKASTSDPQMNMKEKSHSHKRRSNSDIPLSVQTGAFLHQYHDDLQQQLHPAPMSFDPYMSNPTYGYGDHQQQHQHQQFLSWQAQQQQQQRSAASTMRPNGSSSGMSSTHMSPLTPPSNMMSSSNMYNYPLYNYQNFPPPPMLSNPPPSSSPRSLSRQQPSYNLAQNPPPPQPPQYYHHQQQHFMNPFHPSQQQMQYNPHLQGAPQPMFYPYPPVGPSTSKTGAMQQPPPTIQKSASYAGAGSGMDGSGRIAPGMKSKPPPVPMDERQPLLTTSLSFDRRTATNPAPQPPNSVKFGKHVSVAGVHPPPRGQMQQPSNEADGNNDTGRRHRRSLSSPAAGAFNYGAFWDDNDNSNMEANITESLFMSQRQLPTVATRSINTNVSSNKNTSNPQQFSPMAEFRKLQKGLSPKGSSSSTGRKQATVVGNSKPSSFRDNNNNIHNNVPMAPVSPTNSNHPRLHTSLNDFNYHPSPQQHHHRTLSYSGDGAPLGYSNPPPLGSRSLLLQRGESLRKMHARQKSAQLLVEDVKGIEQPLTCRNVAFLLLFVFHLLFMVYLGQEYGPNAFVYHGTDTDAVTIVYSNLFYIAIWSGLFAVGISALLLGAMTYFASHFVQIALFFMITLSFIWGTIGIGLSPKTTVPVTGIIALALAVAYTFIVWDRIPFASANLVTALTALRDFRGIIYVAFGFQLVALLYSVAYSILVFGIYDAMQDHGPLNLSKQMTYVVYILLVFSFSWTLQVIQGTVQAITAAVIYKWWHEGRTDQNTTLVKESCLKTIFYSTGSICFGSLVVGPVRFLRWFFVLFRPSSTESSSLMCFHECVHYIQSCVSFCVDSLSAKCNSWAYTYIGMYHYGFLEAGGNATELFEKRGWSTIVSDDLVPNVLFLTSLVIGGITGCFAYLLSELDRLAVVIPKDEPGLAPFVEGVIIGLVLPSVVFCLISSSVNAVLVCFASSPMDFEIRHPTLSHDMRAAWRDVWPRALLVDDAVAIRLVDQNSPFIQSTYQGREPSPF